MGKLLQIPYIASLLVLIDMTIFMNLLNRVNLYKIKVKNLFTKKLEYFNSYNFNKD